MPDPLDDGPTPPRDRIIEILLAVATLIVFILMAITPLWR